MKKLLFATAGIVAAGLLTWQVIVHWLGVRTATGTWPYPAGTPWTYQLLSGFLPALVIIQLTGMLGTWYYHNTCHEKPSCLRWGRYEVAGGIGKKCREHHPDFRDHHRRQHGKVLDRLHEEWKARQ